MDRSIVEEYLAGARYRDIKAKYKVSAESINAILKAHGEEPRKGGRRRWIRKRVRMPEDTELVCTKCHQLKPVVDFLSRGLVCRKCSNEGLAVWRNKNRQKMNRYMRGWVKSKKKKDPKFRAICAMKCRLVRILAASGKKKSKASVTEFLGISRNGFMAHIESLMLPGMTWENRRLGVWHIDHIIPCSAFDHSDPKQVRECWHYTNLRPLWGKENLRKYNKISVDLIIGPKISADVTGE